MDMRSFKAIIDHIEKDREGDGYWLELRLSFGKVIHGDWRTIATGLWMDGRTVCPSVIGITDRVKRAEVFLSVADIITVSVSEVLIEPELED